MDIKELFDKCLKNIPQHHLGISRTNNFTKYHIPKAKARLKNKRARLSRKANRK